MTETVLEQGRAISQYFVEQRIAATADVPRPAILDAPIPEEPALLMKHQADVEMAEEVYVAALLKKKTLTAAEQKVIGKAIAAYGRRAALGER